ncbi:unnamed protein product [Ostreobium quekettii]|uniref:Coatomer subunit alpha n=1 Tax=Ostreobium quekettii TaxID=121088 RepID=A0A8S1JDW2_9CHLO|nr:unnamed protein product [Ostreobium quekettii]|eukprot:evm.model.scf_1390.2 EVM.evm.TU.scf_1390.2   scf_1390:26068-40024(-)
MLTKFETKSNRVKGLAFHPRRPWILASLHSGVIQLWDYRVGTTIDKFDEHDGPVRGVHFHRSQPLFVSGGDDYKIKVWNYKLRRCLFTLHGHLDYIRTVEFHDEHPWIVSASDDQTIRIWNWMARNCVAVLTGHNHYVMCASFHMKEDLVVSASLDQTVRVWDISGLRKKSMAPGGGGTDPDMLRLPQQMGADLFGGGDAVVKYVLEGHDRGVNWASFHPTMPLIVSGADDRQVKLWRYNESKAWEVDTLRGHVNNVSCVIFHAKQDLIISNSEDKSIRVWDLSKRQGVQTIRREQDRFWILVAHPEQNVLAAGHDSGMTVFKLERERPPYAAHGDTLYYVKDRYLRRYDFKTQRDNPVISIRKPPAAGLNSGPRSLSYSPADNAVLLTSDVEGGSFELYTLPKDPSRGDSAPDAKSGLGACAVFIARNRFAVLEKLYNQIQIRNLQNEITKKVQSPCPVTMNIFYAGTGRLLCQSEDKVVLFEIQNRQVLAETAAAAKYVVWNQDMSRVALINKHSVTITDKMLNNSCTVHEHMRVKSAAFDPSGVLIYTSLNHIKYCLPNGDNGIIRTLDAPVYLTKVVGNAVYCLDREGKNRKIEIDSTEFMFKLALSRQQFDQVMYMIQHSDLCGQAIISYLQEKGFPDVALHFVKDERLRFNLAVECGNIEVALQSAQELDDKETWYRLGVEALRQGNHQIVEYSYQRTKSFDRLAFLYLITGNVEKLNKMMKIAEMYNDTFGRFENALYLGDVRERIKILEESGQGPLAYVTAKTHGLQEEADRLRQDMDCEPEVDLSDTTLLQPVTPILREANWPLLVRDKSLFEGALSAAESKAKSKMGAIASEEMEEIEAGGAWGEDELDLDVAKEAAENGEEVAEEDDGEGGWDDDLADLDLPPADFTESVGPSAVFVAPNPGMPPYQRWLQKCSLPAQHAAAGDFGSTMRLLNRQLGFTTFAPLKPLMLDMHRATRAALPGLASLPPMLFALDESWSGDKATCPPTAPTTIYTLPGLEEELKKAYKLVTLGKFSDAMKAFMGILQTIPLVVVESRKEVDDIKELVGIAKEYIIGLLCEQRRREEDNPVRAGELAAYFTHCKLEPVHTALALKSAMTLFYKLKNFNTCAVFCRRLLELNPAQRTATQARQVLAACEKNPTDAVEITYDPRNPFDICCITFTPIYRGFKFVECPYTGARFQPDCKGQLSPLGGMARIGADASGLICSPTQVR